MSAGRTVAERVGAGRALRRRVPRSEHARHVRPEGADPLAQLEEQARDRVQALVPIRHGRMAASPFAYFRGAALPMAADLSETPVTGITAQLCGDAHLSNFGGFASAERGQVFDINDFDETLPGPWEWDLKRLAASLAILGRQRGFSARERAAIVSGCVGQYQAGMRELAGMRDIDVFYSRLDQAEIERRWGDRVDDRADMEAYRRHVRKARGKDSLRAMRKLTAPDGDGRPRIVNDPPRVVPIGELYSAEQAGEVRRRLDQAMSTYRSTLPGDRRRLVDGYELVDVAFKVVGVGSVGTRAWIALFLGRDEGDPLFLQVKQATASVLERYAGRSRFRHHGRRVIEGQRLIQSSGDVLLGWGETQDLETGRAIAHYYLRQLWDRKETVDVETIRPPILSIYAEMCGWALARAHARTSDRVALAAYLGTGDVLRRALCEYAEAYADQNETDYAAFMDAIDRGKIEAQPGV